MENLFWFLLPVAALFGWLFGWRAKKKSMLKNRENSFSSDYYQGLNYLLNEQQDKAIEVFVKLVEVDSETVETHLALGSLFRRRGEVDRAIRIHQNLIARPSLDQNQRGLALIELAKDYMGAGLLDRAEGLFNELIKQNVHEVEALENLLEVYQQESEWQKAIDISRKLAVLNDKNMDYVIAQYYCEVADQLIRLRNIDKAEFSLKRALDTDSNCVRASIILGNISMMRNDHKQALKYYLKVFDQDKDYISEVMSKALICIKQGAPIQAFKNHMQRLFSYENRSVYIPGLVQYIYDVEGKSFAEDYLNRQLDNVPTLVGIKEWIALEYDQDELRDLRVAKLVDSLDKIFVEENRYLCRQCGYTSKLLYWRCPSCKAWSTIKPVYAADAA